MRKRGDKVQCRSCPIAPISRRRRPLHRRASARVDMRHEHGRADRQARRQDCDPNQERDKRRRSRPARSGLHAPRRSGAKTCCPRSSAPAQAQRAHASRAAQAGLRELSLLAARARARSADRDAVLQADKGSGAARRADHSRQQPRAWSRLPGDAVQHCSNGPSRAIDHDSVAAHLRRLRRGQRTRAAARLAASLRTPSAASSSPRNCTTTRS